MTDAIPPDCLTTAELIGRIDAAYRETHPPRPAVIVDTLAPELVYAIPTDEGVRIGWVDHSRVGGVYSALHVLSGHAVICTLTGGQIAMGSCLLTDLAPDVHMIALRAVGPGGFSPRSNTLAIQPCEHRCAHVEACPMCKPCDDALTRDLMEGL